MDGSPARPRPTRSRAGVLAPLVLGAALVALLGLTMWRRCGREGVATLPLSFGAQTTALRVAEGTLFFTASARSASTRGANEVVLHVEGLRGGEAVASTQCVLVRMKRGTTLGSPSWDYDDCELGLPVGGVEALRITARLEESSEGTTFEDLRVHVAKR